MTDMNYIPNVSTLTLKSDDCVGCGLCEPVCPHRVLQLRDKKIHIVDKDACMECGACTRNCPSNAIEVSPGVGCAAYIIKRWLFGGEVTCC